MMKSTDRLHRVLIAALLLTAGFGLQPARAEGDRPDAAFCTTPDLGGDGSPESTPFLLQRTDVRITITGPVAHVRVIQGWENRNRHPVDGLYVFPLPENAAVTDMSLKIGDRIIRGAMKRRDEARAIYEQARREGRVTGLLDQERPNVFAQRVANIMPGVRLDVTLEFDQEIGCEGGACGYVFPTVVGTRFVPAEQFDPGEINPPVVPPGGRTGQRLAMTVDIDAGTPLHDIASPSHRVTIERHSESRATVTLAGEPAALLDRDVRLVWRIGTDAPEIGLLTWRDPEENDPYGIFSLIIQPPADGSDDLTDDAAPARELIFVLDCSGSMSGVPIEAAKNVVRQALGAVRPQDTFQIIRFSERASGLGPAPLLPSHENLRRAHAHLDSLRGSGGTRMIEGIRAALGSPADPRRMRIVAFLTDGYIGNESDILAEVGRLIGDARLFAFGIGSSVNRYLLEGLAEEGRGQAAFLGPRESADAMVSRFVKRIATPVLTDVRITWEDLEVEDLEPAAIPDLFAGQPLILHGRYRNPGTGVVVIEGRRGDVPVTLRRVVILRSAAADNEALARLWARARIHRLTREMYDGERHDVKEAITSLGLRYNLMTAWTSLVAVDSVVSNLTGSSTPLSVPVELPEDVSYEGIIGTAPLARGRMQMVGKMSMQAAPSLDLAAEQLHSGFAVGAGVRESADAVSTETKPAGRDADAPASRFDRLVLVEADGTRLIVEADGEVWWERGRQRRLVRSLSAALMEEIRSALAATRPARWTGGGATPRLIFEAAGKTTMIGVRDAEPAIENLTSLIRRSAR